MSLFTAILVVLLVIGFFILKPMLTGRDSYSGTTLKPGISTVADVEQLMGKPAQVWKNATGQVEQMVFVRGPAGFVSFMVHFAADGNMTAIDQVLDEKHFAQIPVGATQDDVLKILGPARSTNVFAHKHQLYWNYGFCSEHGKRMEYGVQFDTRTLLVTGSDTIPDPLVNGSESGYCTPWRQPNQ